MRSEQTERRTYKKAWDVWDHEFVMLCGRPYLWHGESGAPIVFEDVQTNDPLTVDVAMVNASAECHLGRFKRILRREMNIEKEHPTFIHGTRRSQNGGDPFVDVVTLGSGATQTTWVLNYRSITLDAWPCLLLKVWLVIWAGKRPYIPAIGRRVQGDFGQFLLDALSRSGQSLGRFGCTLAVLAGFVAGCGGHGLSTRIFQRLSRASPSNPILEAS